MSKRSLSLTGSSLPSVDLSKDHAPQLRNRRPADSRQEHHLHRPHASKGRDLELLLLGQEPQPRHHRRARPSARQAHRDVQAQARGPRHGRVRRYRRPRLGLLEEGGLEPDPRPRARLRPPRPRRALLRRPRRTSRLQQGQPGRRHRAAPHWSSPSPTSRRSTSAPRSCRRSSRTRPKKGGRARARRPTPRSARPSRKAGRPAPSTSTPRRPRPSAAPSSSR